LLASWASKPTRSEEDLLKEYKAQKELSLMNGLHLRPLFAVVKCLHLADVNYSEDLLEE
jgi:hypothetical protein